MTTIETVQPPAITVATIAADLEEKRTSETLRSTTSTVETRLHKSALFVRLFRTF